MNANWLLAGMLGIIAITSVSTYSASSPESETPSSDSFAQAIAFTEKWEGGQSDHPLDGGGRTGRAGITQRTYDAYRITKGLPTLDVFSAPLSDTKEIYRQYWENFGCKRYAHPLATACFDSYITFNPQTAASLMSRLDTDPEIAAKQVALRRMAFRKLRVAEQADQRVFLQGWLNRDKALLDLASAGQ